MTEPYWSDGQVTLFLGDCLDVLAGMDEASVDAIATDPPYGLEFMGSEWDGADGFRRSLNPADAERDSVFGRASRTGPEHATGKPADARIGPPSGRDGQPDAAHNASTFLVTRNMPESCSTGNGYSEKPRWTADHMGKGFKQLPNHYEAGNLYQEWCLAWATLALRVLRPGGHMLAFGGARTVHRLTCGIEDAGFEIRDSIDWIYAQGFPKSLNIGDGLGTGLKPAHEPIVVARKPLAGTVRQNVAAHGTGALNIDACRVPATDQKGSWAGASKASGTVYAQDAYSKAWTASEDASPGSRWPPNVLLGEDAAAELDRQSGVLTSGANPSRRGSDKFRDAYGEFAGQQACVPQRGADQGGASRFFPVFRYEAKAGSAERPRGDDGTAHPTVKPLELMRWLVRLVTPVGGLVLDPFGGSGTTAEACVIEGFRCILIEQDPRFADLIVKRLDKPIQQAMFGGDAG